MALHLPGFLHSADLLARPKYCSAQGVPMAPILLQVKDKPLAMANESLHTPLPALLPPHFPLPLAHSIPSVLVP